uniref:receptor protein-tyrosine kinase n=1 Tax=Myripristis murdjan TaxID=586833 RepID=A0A667X8U3_9TELE
TDTLLQLNSPISAGKESKGKYSLPLLDVKARQLVLETNQTLLLNCRGRWELVWAFPAGLSKDQGNVQVEESRCGRTGQQYCSRLTVSQTLAQHTGPYRCRYRHRTSRQTSVYVYIADSRRPFVELRGESPDVLYMKERESLLIPCRATHPNTTASLVKFPNHELRPDQRNIIWNSKRGFTIRSPTYFYIGLFFCQTATDGVKHSSHIYFIHRPVSNIMEVYLNSSGPVQALKGEKLALNCTATGELNTRVNITWDYPGKENGISTISKRILNIRTHMLFYSILTIPKLQRSDRGLYTCRVTSGEKIKRETKVTVTVYDRPFIHLKPRNGSVMEVQAGQKSYRLSPKLRAFPAPEIIWMKDGTVAAEQCSRYHVDGNSLVIRDVAEEDAGKYTVLVGIQEHGLKQNLTLTLVVKVSPQIGEKAVSLQDPGTVPRGSRQALHCTSHGVPAPHIQWLWHRCPSKGLCVCPMSSSLWSPVRERVPGTSTHNHVLSVTHRQEVLQGKNKTVGVLTVEAFVSGVYRCVASNSVGTDHLDIHFYITDIPGGFSVSQREEPREGGDLQLTCKANKYLYTALSWQRVTNKTEYTGPQRPALSGQLTSGDFSCSLSLLLSNLTPSESGTYRCSARHLLTGQETHLDTQVEVTVLEPPVLLHNLTDCSVNVSSSVTLSCPAQGVPLPTITWYKNEMALSQGSGIVMIPEDGTLHIDRITVEDQGLYTCQATNQRGSVESSAYIWVNGGSEPSFLEIPTLTCTCVVATLFWLLLTLFIRKLKQCSSTKPEYLSIILDTGEGPMEEQCERLQYDPNQWEFPRERLKLEKPLGRGAFGKVMQASAFGIDDSTSCSTVAVKMLKEGATASEHKALMTELKILNHIGHHLNVVNLLGACTKPGGPLMIIVEYCRYGNLSTYLKSKRQVFVYDRVSSALIGGRQGQLESAGSVSNSQSSIVSGFEEESEKKDNDQGKSPKSVSSSSLFLEDLISFSFQVARGMEFLASRKCIHRDLAARNILLSENKVVKICDFGLARDIYKDPDYVRKGDARLPLKWMSPESIFDKVFTIQSDVWSFGILLWEIFSLGASPYPGLHIDEEFCHRLKEGTRMRAPEYSTPEIYSTMLACWEANPSDRPTFTDLVETLGDLLQARVQQVRSHTHMNAHTHMHRQHGDSELKTSQTQRVLVSCVFQDEQSDSGMVLPSEELKHLVWGSSTKNRKLSSLMPKEGGSPPPDYNSAFLYPSL